MFTTAEENYIKAVYHLQQAGKNVLTNDLAGSLQTKPASVTDMLKKLEAKGLLLYQKYYGVRLTNDGKKLALAIIRRHRLWEYFLVEHLQFGWDEVHEIAEQLEHVKSDLLTDKLDVYMGSPKFDPHGDPIPDSKGRIEVQQQVCLLQLKPGQGAAICAVTEQSSELLEMLRMKQLQIGTRLEVKQHFNFDNSMEIQVRNQPPFSISEQLAKHLFVKLK
ncbi:MAG: metal-dependent transcriptional regulator [Chitinophagaceae bacterium]